MATHTKMYSAKIKNNEYLCLDFPLKHPPFVIRDRISDELYFNTGQRIIFLQKL